METDDDSSIWSKSECLEDDKTVKKLAAQIAQVVGWSDVHLTNLDSPSKTVRPKKRLFYLKTRQIVVIIDLKFMRNSHNGFRFSQFIKIEIFCSSICSSFRLTFQFSVFLCFNNNRVYNYFLFSFSGERKDDSLLALRRSFLPRLHRRSPSQR